MIPLRDANPTRRTAVVTLALIAACAAVFVVELGISSDGGDAALGAFFREWGVVPARVSAALSGAGDPIDAARSLLTSLFLHAGWAHLIGNMLFLWIFGNNIEDRLGRIPFVLFYVGGGAVAGLTQVMIAPEADLPLVGASGAIAAVLGAYLVLYPRARVLSFVFLGFFYQLLEVPAVLLLGFWFAFQLVDGVGSLGAESVGGGVAFFAHIGGFVAGALVAVVLRLAGPARSGPRVRSWPS